MLACLARRLRIDFPLLPSASERCNCYGSPLQNFWAVQLLLPGLCNAPAKNLQQRSRTTFRPVQLLPVVAFEKST